MARPLGVEQGAVYEIIAPSGARAVLNDSSSPDFAGFLTGPPTGLERAGVRESADVLPEADGGVHGMFYRDRLPFTLPGIIDTRADGPNAAAQDRLLRATKALRADALLRWTPSTIPEGVQVAFREQQPTRITSRRPKTFLVAGVAEDPFVYSQLLRTQVIDPAIGATGGFSSPLRSPLVSTAALAGTGLLLNDGSAETWPLLTISGPCTNPIITNATLGLSIAFLYTLAANEYLVIDTNPRRRRVLFGAATYANPNNYIPNPRFAGASVAGWGVGAGWFTSAGAAITPATLTVPPGIPALNGTLNGSSLGEIAFLDMPNLAGQGDGTTILFNGPFAAGSPFTASVWIWGVSGDPDVTIYFGDQSADRAALTTTAPVGVWTRRDVTWTPSTTRTGATFGVVNMNNTGNPMAVRLAGAQVEEGATVGNYRDGSMAGFGWEGAAHASATHALVFPTSALAARPAALDFVNSRWWPLTDGLNDIRLAFSSYSLGAKVAFEWRDAWG